jgi:hypothetical protein
MRIIRRVIQTALLPLMLNLVVGQMAHAHLMVAQHGTLNIVEDGVFMVLSLPISAFEGVDDDGNGEVSMQEFNNHRGDIIESVTQSITLGDKQGNVPLQGIMLSPVVPHGVAGDALSQLTVMGRFTLNGSAQTLRFHIGLFGRLATEQMLEITATRVRDDRRTVFKLTPSAPARAIFSASA